MNQLSGEVPDLSSLTNLQVLDLEDNSFGPVFPRFADKVVTLVLKKNRFSSAIPEELSSSYQLKWIDISFNRFVGPFPKTLLTLPSITYLNIAGNRFTGILFENMSCSAGLDYVDFLSNLLIGQLLSCLLSNSENRVVHYAKNCLATKEQSQHHNFYCRREALAVGIIPRKQKNPKGKCKTTVALSVVGGIIFGVALVGMIFILVRRIKSKKMMKIPPTRLIKENVSIWFSSKLFSDARYISQTMRLGALCLPAYRTFSLEELERASNNIDTSSFLGEGSHGQMYRGRLNDGSLVAIRCLKLNKRHTTRNFVHHIELISKLRHCNLLQVNIMAEDMGQSSVIDPLTYKLCSEESLKTVASICLRALLNGPAERPSIEDMLWNLQFAAQVQDEWRADSQSQSSKGSPVSPS